MRIWRYPGIKTKVIGINVFYFHDMKQLQKNPTPMTLMRIKKWDNKMQLNFNFKMILFRKGNRKYTIEMLSWRMIADRHGSFGLTF